MEIKSTLEMCGLAALYIHDQTDVMLWYRGLRQGGLSRLHFFSTICLDVYLSY
jgi:hypothetical protein